MTMEIKEHDCFTIAGVYSVIPNPHWRRWTFVVGFLLQRQHCIGQAKEWKWQGLMI